MFYHHYLFGFGPFFMFIFWGLVIWLVIWLFRGRNYHGCCGHNKHSHEDGGRAMDILKERLAKGEIDKEEYEKIKKELEK